MANPTDRGLMMSQNQPHGLVYRPALPRVFGKAFEILSNYYSESNEIMLRPAVWEYIPRWGLLIASRLR